MTDIDHLIAYEKTQIGTKESPANSNKQKYGEAYDLNGYPWCVMFQWYCFKETGLSDYFFGGGKTASCTVLWNYHKDKVVTGNYRKGDLLLFNFNGGKVTQHIGLCTGATKTTVTTIDGNTGTSSEANGGAVLERTRNIKYVVKGIRLLSQPSTSIKLEVLKLGSTGKSVEVLQTLLNAGLDIDGEFGAKTQKAVIAYQKENALEPDGQVGKNTWNKLLGGC